MMSAFACSVMHSCDTLTQYAGRTCILERPVMAPCISLVCSGLAEHAMIWWAVLLNTSTAHFFTGQPLSP
jgi:hypothetical protein